LTTPALRPVPRTSHIGSSGTDPPKRPVLPSDLAAHDERGDGGKRISRNRRPGSSTTGQPRNLRAVPNPQRAALGEMARLPDRRPGNERAAGARSLLPSMRRTGVRPQPTRLALNDVRRVQGRLRRRLSGRPPCLCGWRARTAAKNHRRATARSGTGGVVCRGRSVNPRSEMAASLERGSDPLTFCSGSGLRSSRMASEDQRGVKPPNEGLGIVWRSR
jgi:hypothetical protein